jgi:hypothetical protein
MQTTTKADLTMQQMDRRQRAFARALRPGDPVAYWNSEARTWEHTTVVWVKRGPLVLLESPRWWVSHIFVGPPSTAQEADGLVETLSG